MIEIRTPKEIISYDDTNYNTQQDVVKNLRKLRDQINNENKDMNFEEERAYLDTLLTDKGECSPATQPGKSRADESK